MAARKRLATFVHISDIHIGRTGADGDSEFVQAWRIHPQLDGLLGHEYAALALLERFVADLRLQEDIHLIVTGDLSRVGHPDELSLADGFLAGRSPFGGRAVVGLEAADWKTLAVPGNHDHWDGTSKIVGGPAVDLKKYFGGWSNTVPPMPLDRDFTLQMFRIDTDADVVPVGMSRLLARGHFLSELQSLEESLRGLDPKPREIRVLLMHHSPSWEGTTLGIGKESRTALDRIAAQYGISVILSGHTHEPATNYYPVASIDEDVYVFEATCGTSAQRSYAPLAWGRGLSRVSRNAIMVHRMWLVDNRRALWETTTYKQSWNGFQEVPSLFDSAVVFVP